MELDVLPVSALWKSIPLTEFHCSEEGCQRDGAPVPLNLAIRVPGIFVKISAQKLRKSFVFSLARYYVI